MTEEITRPIGIDLFCGAGGMSLGFEQAGFNVVAAVDIDPLHTSVYQMNFPNCTVLTRDLTKLSGTEIRTSANLDEAMQIDVLFGGSPCQGVSFIGRRDPADPRNELFGHFARLVAELTPQYFVLENVPGLLEEPMRGILDSFREHIAAAEYDIVDPIAIINAYDFGVPQRRQRVFILGYRRGLVSPQYPVSPFDANPTLHRPTVWDAIGDLPNVDESDPNLDGDVYSGELNATTSRYASILRNQLPDPDDLSLPREPDRVGITGFTPTMHSAEVVARFMQVRPGSRDRASRFPRLERDGICPTLRAGTSKEKGSYSAARPIHPSHPRCITLRESARLHSYPDWFVFHSTKWHGLRQVGNSVPPLLARAVAQSIRACLENNGVHEDD